MASDSEVFDDILNPDDSEIFVDERKHNKLLDAISSLSGSKRHKLTQRTVFSNQISEFNFATSKDGHSKVQLHELVGSLKESGSHGTLKKQLNTVNKKKQLVDKPLPKHEKEKIDRTTAYESTTVDLTKWDPVVKSNRQADQLEFPLKKSDVRLVSSQQFVGRFQPRTPLEIQVAALLRGSDNVFKNKQQELTPAEQRALRAMDLEEAQERRNELCKHRALLSYKEAKAKRHKKIKSKKYHRILKREKLKKETKDLDDMKTRDPEGYDEKIKELETARIEERITLKHRGGSKFARRQMLFAKYNDKARDQVQEMLQMSRELTKKSEVQNDPEDLVSDEEADMESQATSAVRSYKGDNPWMARPQAVQAQAPNSQPTEKKSDGDDDEKQDGEMEEKQNDGAIDSRMIMIDIKNDDNPMSDNKIEEGENGMADVSHAEDIDEIFSKLGGQKKRKKEAAAAKKEKLKTKKQKNNKDKKGKNKNVEKKIDKQNSEDEDKQLDEDDVDEGFISEGLSRKRTLEDIEEMLDDEPEPSHPVKKARAKGDKSEKKKPKMEPSVDPKQLFTLETRMQQTGPGPDMIEAGDDEEDIDLEEQQRMTIAQAFADDDVINEFAQEKKEKEDKDKPKDIDLFLPGWGTWGGTGVAPPKRRKKRFTIKAAPAAPRRDMGLGNVIINENNLEAVKKHQVSEIPFPFRNAEQFEYSIRAPVGRTWNPETAFQQLTMPKIKTQIGAIIAPLDKSEVFKNQKKTKTDTPDKESGTTKGRQNQSRTGKMQNKKHRQKRQEKKVIKRK